MGGGWGLSECRRIHMSETLKQGVAAIDGANAKDPRMDEGQPEALVYGQRMSEECARLFPQAPETLQIAARGPHP